jgi:hypothetical protein
MLPRLIGYVERPPHLREKIVNYHQRTRGGIHLGHAYRPSAAEYVVPVLLFAIKPKDRQLQKGRERGIVDHLVEDLEKGKTNPGGFH